MVPAGVAAAALAGAPPGGYRAPFSHELATTAEGTELTFQHEPGGLVVAGVVHPAITILKWGWRVLPEESWYSPFVGPQSPIQFELGAFQVPDNSDLWLFDFECSVYRFSGLDPADWVKAENGRFSGMMAFDLAFNNTRLGNVRWELDPHAIQLQRDVFAVPYNQLQPASAFNKNAANSFAATASQGLALFPPGVDRLGPRNGPFAYISSEGVRVALSTVIWRRLTSPVACVEGVIAGYILPRQLSQQLLAEISPR